MGRILATSAVILLTYQAAYATELGFITDRLVENGHAMSAARGDRIASGVTVMAGDTIKRTRLDAGVASRPNDYGDFIFVHGYNRGFKKSAALAVGLGEQLNKRPILFSWPSVGRVDRYIEDRANAEWAAADLAMLLQARTSHYVSLPIIAHSMGAVVVLEALMQSDVKVDRLVLIAADVDVAKFERYYQSSLGAKAQCVLLVVADNDKALRTSQSVNGYQRVGSWVDAPTMKNIDVIDVSDVNDSFIGHEYFVDNMAIAERINTWLTSTCSD